MNKSLFVCILLLITQQLPAQIFFGSQFEYDGRFSDTIPYKLVENKIIFEGSINGKPANFFLDTGGARSVFSIDSMAYYGAVPVSRETVGDANGGKIQLAIGFIPNLSLGKHFKLKQASTAFYPATPYFRYALGVVGSIGADMLKDVIIAIHPRESYIIIHYPYRPKGRSTEGCIEMVFKNYVPAISMTIEGSKIKSVFDTGAGYFLSLTTADYRRLKSEGKIGDLLPGDGLFDTGISGDKSMREEDIGLCTVNGLKIGDKEFNNVQVLTRVGHENMIGVDLLKYGNIMIDYQREMFFFFPFDDLPINVYEDTREWNIRLSRDKEGICRIDAVLGEAGVKVGERVWSINGVAIEDIDWKYTTFYSYLQRLDGDEAKIAIGETKSKTRTITIKRL